MRIVTTAAVLVTCAAAMAQTPSGQNRSDQDRANQNAPSSPPAATPPPASSPGISSLVLKEPAYSYRCIEYACKRSNAFAVWHRLIQFDKLYQSRKTKRKTLPGMKRGKPTDAIFRAFAVVPITGRDYGDPPPHKWPPFDVDELFRLIQREEVPNVG